MPKIITIWEREQKGVWEHNHISDGYDENVKLPTGDIYQTKSWANGNWRSVKAHLTDDNIIELLRDREVANSPAS